MTASNPTPPRQGRKIGWSLPPLAYIGFGLAILAVVLITLLSYNSLSLQVERSRRMVRALETIERLQGVLSLLKDAETGQRGYLLTREEAFLAPYEQAKATLADEERSLRELAGDNPEALRRLTLLEQAIETRMVTLGEAVRLQQAGQPEEALALVRTQTGKQAMETIRALVRELDNDERKLFELRTNEWQATASRTTVITLGGAVLLLILILIGALLTGREFRARSIQAWLKEGQSRLTARVMGETNLAVVAQELVRAVATYLNAQVGVLYAVEADRSLTRLAAFAGSAESAPARVAPGEGLISQAVTDDRLIHLEDAPASHLRITSALGQSAPTEVAIAPAHADGEVNAVVELGFHRPLQPHELEFLQTVSNSIGLALRTAQFRNRLELILEESQRQNEELQAQQEELKVLNEELDEQTRALKLSQGRLENQQAELEQTNQQLEEQTSLLERQKEELEKRYDELAHARNELEKRAEDLRLASRYKSEFLANMSHELRTPLNSALILSKLLADNAEGNLTDEQVGFARTINSSGNDLLSLINDILDLSKVEAGRLELVPEPIEPAKLVQRLERVFQPMAREKGLRFAVVLDEGLPKQLTTDPQRVEQILKNFLSNAFKFTERGEVALRVVLESSATGSSRIGFTVRDSGIGIPAEQQQIIFEAFRQADGTTNRRYGGTGLGLTISRDLARLLGGEVTVQSTPGQGSAFTLLLPLQPTTTAARPAAPEPTPRPAPAAPTRNERPPAPPPRPVIAAPKPPPALPASTEPTPVPSGQRRLLVVEDDARFAEILKGLAEELGFSCVHAGTAEEGWEQCTASPPDAIVLDVRLPDLNGMALLDRLKSDPATRHIPVHMLSVEDYAKTALHMGAIGYLLKPADLDALRSVLGRIETRLTKQMKRLLIVEDDAVQRDAVRRLVETRDVSTVTVSTGAEAMEQLRNATFDCVILDLKLPDMRGDELLERLAEDEAFSFPPVIVYTGRSLTPEEEERLRRFSSSIVIKGARSPERLLDEVTLFLHQVERDLPPERQKILRQVRHREQIFEGRTILVVDDDVRNIFALTRVLEQKGAKVEVGRNGHQALEALDRGPKVDIVLMDIMMPEMDGYEAIRRIREQPKFSKLPIVAVTARAMRDDQERCLRAGANDYLAKPIDVDKLLSLLRVWMPAERA